MPRLRLSEGLRDRLKEPLGELIHGPPESSIARLREIIGSNKPSKTICVGDFVSRLLVESSFPVDLFIVDNKTMRQETEGFQPKTNYIVRTVNPAGTIEMAAWAAVGEALKKPHSVLMVEGEEDLLTLAAVVLAPLNSLVIYGQPDVGMVAVRADKAKKSETEAIVAQMEQE